MNGEYDCYACIAVNRLTNTYPVRDSLSHYEKLEALEEGDRLEIDGLGLLEVLEVDSNTYDYGTTEKPYYYKEIMVICFTV